jgi:hypothetical protein
MYTPLFFGSASRYVCSLSKDKIKLFDIEKQSKLKCGRKLPIIFSLE